MDFQQYSTKARSTRNPELNWQESLQNSMLGISGEYGELSDHIKKWKYHGHELDTEHIKKELGDILWYFEWLSDLFGFCLEDIAEANIDKLAKRYPNGFESERSLNRLE